MTMKIFGAVMIVSGGYLLGKVRTDQQKKRITALSDLYTVIQGFETALAEFRSSAVEYFEKQGALGESILQDQPVAHLIGEDQTRLASLIQSVKKASYQEALERVRQYLSELSAQIKALEEEVKTGGKALPLVTGAIGFLVAVFLF